MTIIVAQKTTTGVLLGADNSFSDGSRLMRRSTPKILNISDRVAFGSAGIARLGDIARSARWPIITDQPEKDHEALIGEFFRGLLKDDPKDAAFWGLVAIDREIYCVGPGGSVAGVDCSYFAQGNAELVAMGALYVMNLELDDTPTNTYAHVMVTRALQACAEHVECIRPPWSFVETKAP